MATETMVRTYRDSKAYAKDAAQLAKKGWAVQNTATQQPRSGCARIFLIGFLAMMFKPKPEIIVTYVRQK